MTTPLMLLAGTALFFLPFFLALLMERRVSSSAVDLFRIGAWGIAPAYGAYFGVRAFRHPH